MKHDRFEIIAGAIALGEATDEQRRAYREHLTSCKRCLDDLGGELEISRTAQHVAAARDAETWQPELRDAVVGRIYKRSRSWQYGFGVLSVGLAVSIGVHALLVASVPTLKVATPVADARFSATTPVELETRDRTSSAPAKSPAAKSSGAVAYVPQRQMVVMHNVISMQRAPVLSAAAQPRTATGPRQIVAVTVHPQNPPVSQPNASNRPIWERRDDAQAWHTVATTTTTSEVETAPQSFTHSAESMQFGPVRHDRDPMLAGGETSLNPQPPMIAYDEGANGTSAFEVLVDDRGNPTKCVITKSSGYVVLDNTVCKAAMAAKYLPKIQDGRAIAGVYRDAFTFRMQENDDIEGIPHPSIPHP